MWLTCQICSARLAHRCPLQSSPAYHKEDVDKGVEVEGRKLAAEVGVVPEEDLRRDDDGSVEKKYAADEEHS